jgi:hypothetical protein
MSADERPKNSSLEFTLLENGLDFIAKALDELRGEPTARNLKYAVLHLKAGTDLLLKERLRMEDWRLLFENVDDADEQRFAEGDFVSPGTTEVIKRLRDNTRVQLTSSRKRTLRRLRMLRNRIEHFAVRDAKESVMAVALQTLGFALDFIGAEIEPEGLEGQAVKDLDAIREGLREATAFVEERWNAIREALAGHEAVIDCYRCGERAFALSDGARCYFCGYQVKAEEGAAEYAWLVLGSSSYDVADGGEWAVSECSTCSAETLLDLGPPDDADDRDRWVCFTCGSAWRDGELRNCTSCGALHAQEMDLCSDCWEYKISAD